MNMETNQTLEPAGLRISLISVLLEDTIKHPDKLKEVNTIVLAEFDIAPIVRNPQGKLFMQLAGEYYPLTLGKWIQKEKVTFVEDPEEEEVEYNCMMEVKGIHYLFEIEPKNPWLNLNLKEEGKMYYANGDEPYIDKLNEAINKNKKYSEEQKIAYKIHPEISPEPFWGDLENANVYILSGNPGYGGNERKIDRKQAFIEAMMENLNRDASRLIWLDSGLKENTQDEEYEKDGEAVLYHPGFEYWEEKTKELREKAGDDLNICVIELFPYHSQMISDEMKKCASELPSREFVDFYIEKAINDGKWIVIARCKSEWLNRIKGTYWKDSKLKKYKKEHSDKVLITKGQQMFITAGNLKREIDMDSKAGKDTWNEFVEACTCKLKQ